MNEERVLILKMVAEGKITAEEAESLLRTLEEVDESKVVVPQQSAADTHQESVVELLKSGADALKKQALTIKTEVLKNQDKLLREQKQVLKNTLRQAQRDMRQAQRDMRQARKRADRFDERTSERYREPQQEHHLETAEKVDLEMNHRHGDVAVVSWAESAVHLSYQKTVWAEDKETAQQIASKIEVQINHEEDSSERTPVSIETVYPEDQGLWQGNRRRAQVDYWLKVPRQTNLKINNQHGQVSVQKLHGATTIGNRHGNVSVHAVDGPLNLDVQHGNTDADEIGADVHLKNAHGNTQLTKVTGNVEGSGAHGHSRLHDIQGDVRLTYRHGHIKAKGIHGRIELDGHHGRIELAEVRNTFHIDGHHAKVLVDVVQSFDGDCNIKAHHSPVDVVAPPDAFASIQASTRHGTISSEFGGDVVKQKHDQRYNATPNDSGANLQITNHHGSINLRRRGDAPVGEEDIGGQNDD